MTIRHAKYYTVNVRKQTEPVDFDQKSIDWHVNYTGHKNLKFNK